MSLAQGTSLVFTRGDGTVKSITVPYATAAAQDIDGKDIEDYIYNLQVSGDKLRITKVTELPQRLLSLMLLRHRQTLTASTSRLMQQTLS